MNKAKLSTFFRPLFVSLTIIAVTGVAALPCSGQSPATISQQEKSVRPGINERFLDPNLNPSEWLGRFETESREIYQFRKAIVKAVNLKQGDRIADIGAGTGLFTIFFADQVGPRGWVFAVEIAPRFVERIGKLAADQGFANITPLLGAEDVVRMPPESIDVAFVCDTYHHFEYPKTTLSSIKRALRPGGRLVVIDFERIEGVSRQWVLGHVRAGKSAFRKEIEDVGFEFIGETKVEGLKENYFITFRKANS